MKMEKTTPPIFSDKKDIFFQKFATSGDVLRTFSPDNWGIFLQKQEKCFTAPKVSLVDVAEHYGQETAKELIKQQFLGLLRLCSGTINTRGAEAAADLFNSLYGRQLTPYSLMLYFALYPTKYKDTFREFDTQDILKQCGKFLEWWATQQPHAEEEQQQARGDAVSINELLLMWLAEGRTIEQIKQGGLYRFGMITDTMIAEAQKQLTSREPF